MLKRHIGDYHFVADARTGVTMRWGKTIKDNPRYAPVPELADISISNHCTKGCDFCYRSSGNNQEWMTVKDYCQVLDSMNHPQYGNVFQVALGCLSLKIVDSKTQDNSSQGKTVWCRFFGAASQYA